jgi:hypothetical protein
MAVDTELLPLGAKMATSAQDLKELNEVFLVFVDMMVQTDGIKKEGCELIRSEKYKAAFDLVTRKLVPAGEAGNGVAVLATALLICEALLLHEEPNEFTRWVDTTGTEDPSELPKKRKRSKRDELETEMLSIPRVKKHKRKHKE